MMKAIDIYKYRLVMLSVVFLSCTYICAGQSLNNTYLEDRQSVIFKSVAHHDSNYYVVGTTLQQNDPQNYYRIFVGKIDIEGNLSKYLALYDTIPKYFASFHNTSLINTKGELVYAGYAGDSIYKVLFGVTDTSLTNVSTKEYYTPDSYAFNAMDMVQYDSTTYYITGLRTIQSTNNPHVLLIKVDSTGERIWQKLYGGSLQEYAKSLTVLDNGNIMVGAFRYNLSQTNQISNTWLIEVDTGGNTVRQWFDTDDSTYAAEGLLQTQDGGFVYGAVRKGYQTINDVYCYSSIVKLDSVFNQQWEYRDYNISVYSGIFDIEELPDGSIIACGNRTDQVVDYLGGWIIKLSPTGEVIWDRLYQGLTTHNAQNFLSDIDVLPDGSLVAVGQCENPNGAPAQVGWLLKLDSNGCEVENCIVGIGDIEGSQSLKVYPNPATDKLTIEVPEHSQTNTIYISSIAGETVAAIDVPTGATRVVLDTTGYPAGVYLARVTHSLQEKFVILK